MIASALRFARFDRASEVELHESAGAAALLSALVPVVGEVADMAGRGLCVGYDGRSQWTCVMDVWWRGSRVQSGQLDKECHAAGSPDTDTRGFNFRPLPSGGCGGVGGTCGAVGLGAGIGVSPPCGTGVS